MTLLMLLFWLIAGGTLQVVVPAFRHMGQPAFPFLLGVVLYAAVNKKARHKRIVSRPEVQKQTRVVTTRDDVGAALDALLG